jgi:hypothetical protein
VSRWHAKNILIFRNLKSVYIHDRPASQEGRFAVVTSVRRDAVDAEGASDEGAGSRTAKSCGPDASTLASSFAGLLVERRWQKSPITGESTKETVKPLRGECRVFSV